MVLQRHSKMCVKIYIYLYGQESYLCETVDIKNSPFDLGRNFEIKTLIWFLIEKDTNV